LGIREVTVQVIWQVAKVTGNSSMLLKELLMMLLKELLMNRLLLKR